MASSAQIPGARVPLRTKFFFGLGATAESITLAAVGGYAMFYYNQVLGLPATLAGLAITVSLVLDGFADPIVGSLSDRTRGKLGRRHPYMYLAPVPVALCIVALFNPPAAFSHLWLFVWFSGFIVTLRVFMAVYHVPHLALGGELSGDYTERSRIMSWNNLLGMIGTAGTSFVALTFFFHKTAEYPRGLLNPHAYTPFAFAVAGSGMLLLLASAWFTRDRIALLPKTPDDLPAFSPFEFMKDMGSAFSNRNYVFLLIAYFFLSLMLGIRQGLGLYMNTFFWEFTSEQIRWFVIGTISGYFLGFATAARLHGRFDKKIAIIVTCVLLATIPAIAPSLRILGLFPEPGQPMLLPLIIIFTGLGSCVASIMSISVMSALADIADENEVRYGYRQEGVLYSTRALFSKIDAAIGHFFAGMALDIVAFPEKAQPGQVDRQTLMDLALVDAPIATIPGLIAVFFYARYKINRKSYDATQAQLQVLRRERAAKAAPAGQPGAEPDGMVGETTT
ncbi:MAG: MFS transporter [Phenylobacterium sp.]|uniref:MFS transporter n=1 Tax=Phenylobacterium sp. TaxID=1871053 RepID=UPI002723A56F|nr:MFS transporter [Phenylobacterium sp.]MDO8910806.1 MFS transporter [Phenylobacterium sp.]MDO9245591.1 MFS transporter [Phenylobacterium sp.]MDP2009729.1 MFS transporter [Phenylobacterium sp.]MDP3101037.1 MFS transporter [Phenylobacterium sp.]MDP3632865.1 MFS transporter [Phenylobacterium sp.]